MRLRLVSLLLCGASSASLSAYAQPSDLDKSVAQSLFDQAKELMRTGNHKQACPKLEESQRLDPSGGTLLNLALCHEDEGKIAAAWNDFRTALSMARADGRQDRITAAEEHLTALEARLPFLTLDVQEPAHGQEVRLDGAIVGQMAWGVPVPIDPGAHVLTSTAPGRQPWRGYSDVVLAEKKTLSIPPLELAPAVSPAPAPVSGEPAPGATSSQAPGGPLHPVKAVESTRPTVGWLLVGSGALAFGVGSVFGVQALSKQADSDRLCPTDTTCSPKGADLSGRANTDAWIANFGIGLGLVGIGVGTYVLLTPDSNARRAHGAATQRSLVMRASGLPGGGQMNVTGSF